MQKNIFRNKYAFDFANGQKWNFHLPLFSTVFNGAFERKKVAYIEMHRHNHWLLHITIVRTLF